MSSGLRTGSVGDASRAAWSALIVGASVGVLFAGFWIGSGHRDETIRAMVYPGIALAAATFGWLVFGRFELFVLAILAIRSSLDIAGGLGGFGAAGAVSLIFLVAGGIWLLSQPIERRLPVPSFVWPIGAFVMAGSLSILVTRDPLGAAQDVMRFATLVVIVLVVNQLLVEERDLRRLLIAIYVSLAIPVLVGAYQALTGTGYHVSGEFARVRGTFDHPNPFAIYLTMMIVMGVALMIQARRTVVRMLLLLTVIGCGVFLVLTYTRSAWIATIAGLLVVALYQGKRLLPIIGLAAIAVAMMVPSVALRFQDLSTETTESGAAGNSLVWRFEYWAQALELSENPFVGAGLRTVRAQTDVGKEPHNDFIRVYVETGLLGLSAYLWFLGSLVVAAQRSIRRTRRPLERGVAVGFAGCLVALLLLSLVSNVISQLVILWYFLSFAVAAFAAPRIAANAAARDRETMVPSSG